MAASGAAYPEGGLMDFFGLFLGIFGRLLLGWEPDLDLAAGGSLVSTKDGAMPDPNG